MVRRVLFMVREEYHKELNKLKNEKIKENFNTKSNENNNSILKSITIHQDVPSLLNLLINDDEDMLNNSENEQKVEFKDLRGTIIQGISELIYEIDNCHIEIMNQAENHIHADEIILVYGQSKSVEEFLGHAKSKNRNFQVFVAESNDFRGHEMALNLAKKKIKTTLITDTSIFAIMARVNKVIIGANAIMADGGIIGQAGTNLVATAAKYYQVPLIVLSGLYKLSPLFPHNQQSINDIIPSFNNKNIIIPFEDANLLTKIEVLCNVFDYVEPEKIDLFITDNKGIRPSYIYRLLGEIYDPNDKLTEGCAKLDL